MPEIVFDEENRIFRVDGIKYPSVTDVLQDMEFINTTWFTQQGADNGARRHKVCELDDLDDLVEDSVDPDDLPYLNAWRQLKAETGITIIETEKRQYNAIYGYCGKPDALVNYQGSLEVWDRKNTANKQKWHKYQIGGYLGLYSNVFKGRCAYLQSNGKFKLSDSYNRTEREDFIRILTVYKMKKECIK